MTRLLHRLLEYVSQDRYVRLGSLLDIADPGSECGRLIRAWVIKARKD